MKLLVGLCLVAVVAAAPAPRDNPYAQLREYQYDTSPDGEYYYKFVQDDGQQAQQKGQIKNAGRDDESLSVSGSFSWVGPDGVTYTVNYVADDQGYQPEIEQGPGGGVPPAVVASLLG